MVWLLIGLFSGSIVTIVMISLMFASKRADESSKKTKNRDR